MPVARYLWDEFNPESYFNKVGFYKKAIELVFIKQFLNEGIVNILDVGGGSGRIASSLKAIGKQVTIIDINSTAIELAREKGFNAIHCDMMDFRSESHFDMMIAIESLDYVENKSLFFKKANEMLRTDGLFIFTFPNIHSWRFIIRGLRKKKSAYHHVANSTYKIIIEKSGFKIIGSKGFMWLPFRVNSDNMFIPVFIFIEKLFRLNSIKSQSPWLIYCIQKTDDL